MKYCNNCCKRLPDNELTCSKCHGIIVDDFSYFTPSMDKGEDNLKILKSRFDFINNDVKFVTYEIKFKNPFCALTKTKFHFSRTTSKDIITYSGLIYKLFERKKEKWGIVWDHICSIEKTSKPVRKSELLADIQRRENEGKPPIIKTRGPRPLSGGLPGLGKKR